MKIFNQIKISIGNEVPYLFLEECYIKYVRFIPVVFSVHESLVLQKSHWRREMAN